MRIIAGEYRGKNLFLPKDKNTRPLRDSVKENIFNLITHSKKIKIKLSESCVLDLFAGTGSFGIECLSRGAKEVTFFENYPEAIEILKRNLNTLRPTTPAARIPSPSPQKYSAWVNSGLIEPIAEVYSATPPS